MSARLILLAFLLSAPVLWADFWRCHIIDPDPQNHGPDGVTIRDFNRDGLPDLLVPFEEGGYSRVYFHPGFEEAPYQSRWMAIEFPFGGEDNGAGDLDGDGHIDLVINGGHVFFNPGPDAYQNASNWTQMSLFKQQARVPVVRDIDLDGAPDLLVNGATLYRAPKKGKRSASNWTVHTIAETRWPMNALFYDMDFDGDEDLVVADRNGHGTVWFESPSGDKRSRWNRHVVDSDNNISFMKIADFDNDGLKDLITTTKSERSITLFRRINKRIPAEFETIAIPQVTGDFPKGVNAFDYDEDGNQELFVLAKGQGEWMAKCVPTPNGLDLRTSDLKISGYQSRLKMDDAIHADMDGDGDMDIVTTDENGGWGVLWFENPVRSPPPLEPSKRSIEGYQIGELLHRDDFQHGTENWAIEQMQGGKTFISKGVMEIDDAKGCTVWYRKVLTAPLLIEFDVKMIDTGGPNDRVSDLNSFTMAIDPKAPGDLFSNASTRDGSFKTYHGLKLYYVGFGANNNRTARFRRYVGDGTRPLLPQHDLKRSHLPNQWRRVQILSTNGEFKYLIDSERVFDIQDPEPYLSGWFGFRTVRNHMAIDRFRVWHLTKE